MCRLSSIVVTRTVQHTSANTRTPKRQLWCSCQFDSLFLFQFLSDMEFEIFSLFSSFLLKHLVPQSSLNFELQERGCVLSQRNSNLPAAEISNIMKGFGSCSAVHAGPSFVKEWDVGGNNTAEETRRERRDRSHRHDLHANMTLKTDNKSKASSDTLPFLGDQITCHSWKGYPQMNRKNVSFIFMSVDRMCCLTVS